MSAGTPVVKASTRRLRDHRPRRGSPGSSSTPHRRRRRRGEAEGLAARLGRGPAPGRRRRAPPRAAARTARLPSDVAPAAGRTRLRQHGEDPPVTAGGRGCARRWIVGKERASGLQAHPVRRRRHAPELGRGSASEPASRTPTAHSLAAVVHLTKAVHAGIAAPHAAKLLREEAEQALSDARGIAPSAEEKLVNGERALLRPHRPGGSRPERRPQSVVVGVDGSAESAAAFPAAGSIVQRFGAGLAP